MSIAGILGMMLAIIKFLIVIGFLVTIHELGHFLVAKAVGIKVNEFAIGFGPKIFGTKKGGTFYAVRIIPLGGYVSMEGETQDSDDPDAFNRKPVWARFLVVIAGAAVNIIFAVLAFVVMYTSAGSYENRVVSEVVKDSYAVNGGLIRGDEIIAINNKKLRIKDDVTEIMQRNKNNIAKVTVLRNNKKEELNIKPTLLTVGYAGIDYIKSDNGNYTNKISAIEQGSPAEKTGLKVGDRITKINGSQIVDGLEATNIISENANKKMSVEIVRADVKSVKTYNLEMTPVNVELLNKYIIGFKGTIVSDNKLGLIYNSYWKSMLEVRKMFDQIVMLVSGKIPTKYLMGPVGIAQVIGKTAGAYELIYLTVFISLNLGMVNLIPFPPLDGGKLVFLAIEGIRRKPVKMEVEGYFQLIGFSLLILLIIFITFNDLTRKSFIF